MLDFVSIVDKIYYSPSLAREFAPDNFTDYNDNQVRPGLFDASCLYVSGTTSPIDSCSIQLGTQRTQNEAHPPRKKIFMNSPEYERLFLQTIFDYFHEKAEWPTYRHVDQKLLSIDPTIDIKEISQNLPDGFANRFPFNDILDDPAILSIEAIRRCDNSEGDLADFINAVRLFVDKYIELRGDNPRVTGADLKSQLNMSDDSIKRVEKLIYGEHMLYQTHGVDRVDGYGSTWLYTLKREIRRFYGVTSIEDYLERRDKEIITARQQATGQLTLLLGQMYCKPGSNNVDKGIILWKKNLTEPNEKGVKLEVALLNALTRLGVPTLFGGDVERILPDTGETIHSGPSTPIFDLVALHIESPMRGPTAVLISCKSNNDQPRLKDMENLSDVSHKVSKLLPAWLVFGALVNLGEPSSDDFNYRDDVRIWKQSHLQALFHAKEHRYVAQFLWTPPWHWKRDIEILWWNAYMAQHGDIFSGE